MKHRESPPQIYSPPRFWLLRNRSIGYVTSINIRHWGAYMSEGFHNSSHEMIDILSENGCGYTLDLHRGNGDGHVVHWLWAKPVGAEPISDTVKVTDSGTTIAQRLTDLGLHTGPTAPFTTQLDNEVGLLETCPFQPVACEGPHVVASGAGLLPHA